MTKLRLLLFFFKKKAFYKRLAYVPDSLHRRYRLYRGFRDTVRRAAPQAAAACTDLIMISV
jgi:hypothetical protein